MISLIHTVTLANDIELLFVGLPDNVVHAEFYDKESLPTALIVYTKHELFKPGLSSPIVLPRGNWQPLGLIGQIPEEELGKMMSRSHFVGEGYLCFVHNAYMLDTATESLASLMKREKLYLPSDTITPQCCCMGPAEKGVCPDCDRYIDRIERTFPQWLVLVRVDEALIVASQEAFTSDLNPLKSPIVDKQSILFLREKILTKLNK